MKIRLFKPYTMKHLLSLLIFLCAGSIAVYSQPGTLDKTFGEGGIAIGKTYSGECSDLIIQNDGKIISIGTGGYGKVTNGFLLVRYNQDGTPDLSFGDSGRVATQLSTLGTSGAYGALQADGKIVVAGIIGAEGYGNNLTVVRYNANGAIDSSFGNGGIVEESLGGYENPSGILVQPDGKIVVAGSTADNFKGVFTLYVVRYNEDGSHDLSFSNKGILQEFTDPIQPGGIALQPDGKIIVGGDYEFSNANAFFIKRYMKDGSGDKEFGNQGEALYKFPDPINSSYMYSLALQADGKIVSAGSTYTSYFTGNATIVRFNADGSIDNQFGKGGSTITSLGDNTGIEIKDIAIQTSGKIIAGALTYDGYPFTYSNFASIQYTKDGAIDSSFATNGVQITSIDEQIDMNALALQKDGKYILGGYFYDPSAPPYFKVALLRYNNDGNSKQPLSIRIKRWLQHHGISWQSGNNIRYYTVQRSTDGIVYKEIAKLPNSSNSYEDATAINKESYYRLMAIAKDGSRAYSNTVLIDESQQVKMFPNPVKDNLQLQGLATGGKTAVSVMDLQGNVRATATAGGGSYSVNTTNLTPGNYLLKLQHNGTVTTQPFVKE